MRGPPSHFITSCTPVGKGMSQYKSGYAVVTKSPQSSMDFNSSGLRPWTHISITGWSRLGDRRGKSIHAVDNTLAPKSLSQKWPLSSPLTVWWPEQVQWLSVGQEHSPLTRRGSKPRERNTVSHSERPHFLSCEKLGLRYPQIKHTM